MHKPLHRQVHDDDSPTHNRRLLPQYGVGGFLSLGALVVKHKECRKTHSLDNPSDRYEKLPSSTLHLSDKW